MDFRSPDARWPPGQIWWLGMRIYPKAWSMHTRGIWKVKSGLNVNGPQIASFTSRFGPNPPNGLFLFFLYFFFYLIILLIFIIIYTNQLNHFSHKIKNTKNIFIY